MIGLTTNLVVIWITENSSKFVDNFLSYPVHMQTNTQRQKPNLIGGSNKQSRTIGE